MSKNKKKGEDGKAAASVGPKSQYYPDAVYEFDHEVLRIDGLHPVDFAWDKVMGLFNDELSKKVMGKQPGGLCAAAQYRAFRQSTGVLKPQDKQFIWKPSEQFARMWLDTFIETLLCMEWNLHWEATSGQKLPERDRFKRADGAKAAVLKLIPPAPVVKFL